MLDKKYVGLMNQEIDGANSSQESSDLQKHLSKNPEARQYFDELFAMSTVLSAVEEIEPSSNLKKNIMKEILPKKLYTQQRKTFLPSLFERFQMKSALKYAYVFSCGLIFGLLVYLLFTGVEQKGDSFDVSKLYGTMTLKELAGTLKPGDRFPIDTEHVSGSVEVAYSEAIVFIEVKVETQKEINLAFAFDENDLSVYGYAQASGGKGTVHMGQNLVEVAHTGDNTYQIILNNTVQNSTTLYFKITADGGILYDRPIIVRRDTG